ncbi:hypothetical protein HUT16_12355 [Kitasatospora sp. NA04385]|uniref:hypothetical protein n=1 Tax=Kitasatospora sp. NA04385 TaxID=2742135 RepID=UPI0015900AD5|nr:hypothetical protein [Kitasatospora sp. NA04385]QKW19746.1 hypothetical protein HUT16_12355 [Kitasatospora sp. NA04385]
MTYPPQPGAPAPGQPPYQQQPAQQPPPYRQPPAYQQPPYQQPPAYRSPQPPYQQQQPYPQQQFPHPQLQQPSPQPQFPPGRAPEEPPRRKRRVWLRVLVSVLALVLLAVGGLGYAVWRTQQKQAQYAKDNDPVKAWRAQFDKMYRALESKDEDAFVEIFAEGPTREKQRKVFRNLVRMPWDQVGWTSAGGPVKGTLQVSFVHQVAGVDNLPVAEEYEWMVPDGLFVVPKPGLVTEVRGWLDPISGKTVKTSLYPGPWDLYDEMSVEVRDHLVVVSDKAQEAELKRDTDVLAQAAKDDLEAWRKSGPAPANDRKPGAGFFVVLEKDRDAYNKLYLGANKENDNLEAGVNLEVPTVDEFGKVGAGKSLIGGSRIAMDTGGSRFTGSDWRAGVLDIGRHEMGHATAATLHVKTDMELETSDKDGVRRWVSEGFAQYMALRGKDADARADVNSTLRDYPFSGELPGPGTAFYAKEARDRHANYVLAGDALRYMASKYGEQKVFSFVTAHYADPSALDQEIKDATGLTFAQFQDAWAAHVRATAPVRR